MVGGSLVGDGASALVCLGWFGSQVVSGALVDDGAGALVGCGAGARLASKVLG